MRFPFQLARRRTFRRKLVGTLLTIGLANFVFASAFYVVNDLMDQRAALLVRLNNCAHGLANSGVSGDAAIEWMSLEVLYPEEVGRIEVRDVGGILRELWSPEEPSLTARWLNLRVERELEPTVDGSRTLVVFGESHRLLSRLFKHLWALVVLGGAAMCTTFVLSKRVYSRYSGQLLDLVAAADAVTTQKDYSIRAIPRGDEEFRVLGETFNYMLSEMAVREKKLQEQVERAESGSASKAQFLATMSHEIRTPINGIIGISELLQDTDQTAEQASFTRTLNESANSLLRIVNDVLDFSKIEAGHLEIESTDFFLDDVVNGCLETVSTLFRGKDVQILRDVRPEVPKALRGDPIRIRQVILNLLSNALKFTDEGEIVLRVSPEERGWLRFEVKDTGIGIPEDRLEDLFKSFSQIDSANNRKYEGTGLGLVISKQIIEAMGGTMFLQTKHTVGSVFGFRLKLPVIDKEPEQRMHQGPRGLRILLAESHTKAARQLAADLGVGHTVITEERGKSARATLDKAEADGRSFDACLVGADLLPDFLERSGNLPAMPLLVMHGVSSRPNISKIAWPGATAALPRPVLVDNLYWCLSQMSKPDPVPKPALPAAAEREEEQSSGKEPASEESGHGDSPEQRALGRLKVLVVEDNSVNQLIVRRFLKKLGVTCTMAANGEEAVDETRAKAFDLIFMDVQMPVMDGVDAVRIIRDEEPDNVRVPIAALTANVLAADRDYYLGAGFDYHLPKPLKFDALKTFLMDWLRERSARERALLASPDWLRATA